MKNVRIFCFFALGTVLLSFWVSARAETSGSRFDPGDFAPVAEILSGEAVVFDTTSVEVSIDGGAPLQGVMSNIGGRAIAVFCFSNVNMTASVTISGTNALAVLSRGDLVLNATLDLSGADADVLAPGNAVCGGFAGGWGGWSGGDGGSPLVAPGASENGPGYGQAPLNWYAGGGGGAYGAGGGKGAPTWDGGPGGTNYGTQEVTVLWGGSGGAGGYSTNGHGGAGGGALELNAADDLTLGASARVYADGGHGADGAGEDAGYTGGGGSGGSVLLAAGMNMELATGAVVTANGGRGGHASGLFGRGGGGGSGGRIAVYAFEFADNGSLSVSGGSGGASVDAGGDGVGGGFGAVYVESLYPEWPRIQNNTAVDIEVDGASLVATLTSTGYSATAVHAYWGTADQATNAGLWDGYTNLGLHAEGAVITNRLTGLATNQLYYFRFYATNAHGATWGAPSRSFRTGGGPQVNNGDGASDVGMHSARLNGALVSGSDAVITIYWGTNDGVEVKGDWPACMPLGPQSPGAFSVAVGGLSTGQVYYYRCCASNDFGEGWADASVVFTARTTTIVTHDTEQPARYERLEMTIANTNVYGNPFDPDEVDIWGDFTAPDSSEMRINAFWDGSEWKLRFAGAQTGLWTYTVSMEDASGVETCGGGFTVTGSQHAGWVRTSSRDCHYLEHDNGTPFYGVGFCKPWNVSNDMFRVMQSNGCNVFVYWLAPWDDKELVSLESGYDRYDTTNAAEVDLILDAAATNGVHMIFTVWYHGYLRDASHPWGNPDWPLNPFKNLTTCPQFFTDTNAWHYQERLYRYMIARWGYSQHLAMWHLIAEIEGSSAGANADAWHQKVYEYFRDNDPFGHVAGGSSAHVGDWPGGFSVMDAPQVHNYEGAQDAVGIASNVAGVTRRLFDDYTKPNFHGEFGKRSAYGDAVRTLYQHNGVWAALANGAAITPLMWNDGNDWGDQSADMYRQLAHFRGFVDRMDMPAQAFEAADVSTSVSDGLAWGLQGNHVSICWVQDTSPGATVAGGTVTFSNMVRGDYLVDGYDTWNGAWYNTVTTRVDAGTLTVNLPDFTNDMAVRVEVFDVNYAIPVIDHADGVSGIAPGMAVLNGTLTSTGTATTAVSVYWGPSDGGTSLYAWAATNHFGACTSNVPVSYAAQITSLASNQVYYYRYFATNENGGYWATESERFMISEVQVRTTWTNAHEDGTRAATVVVYRASSATNFELTVTYMLDGQATVGVDYVAVPAGTVTLAAGQTEAAIVITPVDDRVDEGWESVEVRLVGDTYVIGTWSNAWVYIEDNDTPVELGAWNYRMTMDFEHYSRPNLLTNFPVLVMFDSNRVDYSQFLPGGADLRFTDRYGIEVDYEIETWNSGTNGASWIWVELPVLSSNTLLYAFWGNPGAAQPPYTTNGAAWNVGYAGVWHLAEGQVGIGAADVYRDATAHGNHGDDWVASTGKAGRVGRGQRFAGNPEYIDCGNNAALKATNVLSMEAWVNVDDVLTGWTNMQVLSKKSHWTNAAGYELELNTGQDAITVLGGSTNYSRAPMTWDTGTWHHIVAVIDDTICQIYVDGVAVTMQAHTIGTLASDETALALGRRPGDTNYPSFMRGGLDEVRVSTVLREPAWVWATYQAQASNDTFVTYRGTVAFDSDLDQLSDAWESNWFGNITTTDGGAGEDQDGDGFIDLHEYLAGTDPTDNQSFLGIHDTVYDGGDEFILRWSSATNRRYEIEFTADLTGPFTNLATDIYSTPPQNIYTDTVPPGAGRKMYRIHLMP
ncbi:MAG: DUF2341 domain-containing protein [Spartobacteria bacterium]|nr:DUF2341 domain-containing protein [Spartobacteria bacterium]